MKLEYSYLTRDGDIRKSEVEAKNIEDARNKILLRGRVIPLDIKEIKVEDEIKEEKRSKVSFKRKDVLIFTKHLSMVINAGIGLRKCFEILVSQEKDKRKKPLIEKIKEDIDSGNSLTRSFSKFPKIFDKFYLSLLEISELTGTLKECLNKIIINLESELKRKKQVKSALIYPSIILSVAISVLIFMLVVILPKFMEMFEGSNVEMPGLTVGVMNLSYFLAEKWYLIVTALIILIFAMKAVLNVKFIKKKVDTYLFKIPLIGKFLNYIIVSKILNNMSTLLAAGITFSQSFEIIKRTMNNLYFKESIADIEESILEGSSIANAFERTKDFPILVTNMIRIGEDSGKLIEALDNSYNYIDEELDTVIAALLTALEPLIILFMAVGVGILVIAMYLPLFKMSEIANA